MDLKNRIDILIQGAELAQKGGVLTLDEAVYVKNTIDEIKMEKNLKQGVEVLANVVNTAQKRGVYTLQDSHYLFLALDGIAKDIDEILESTEEQNGEKEKSED